MEIATSQFEKKWKAILEKEVADATDHNVLVNYWDTANEDAMFLDLATAVVNAPNKGTKYVRRSKERNRARRKACRESKQRNRRPK